MTNTTRPEWMPDLLDVQEQSDLHLGWADDEAMDFIYHVGLRAQIAVLEEISDYYGHTTRDMAVAKIAALQKELSA